MNKFLETCKLLKVSQEEIKTLITSKDIVSIIEKPASKTSPGPDGSTGKFYQSFKEEIAPIFILSLQKKKIGRNISHLLYDYLITLISKLGKRLEENYRPISLMNTGAKFSGEVL